MYHTYIKAELFAVSYISPLFRELSNYQHSFVLKYIFFNVKQDAIPCNQRILSSYSTKLGTMTSQPFIAHCSQDAIDRLEAIKTIVSIKVKIPWNSQQGMDERISRTSLSVWPALGGNSFAGTVHHLVPQFACGTNYNTLLLQQAHC